MSLLFKSATGVLFGSVALIGAVWVSLPKPQSKRVDLQESLAAREEKRVNSLSSIFSNADRSKRLKIVNTISKGGENLLNTIFAFNEDTKKFYDEGYVGTEIDVWCEESANTESLEVLNKEEVCNH